MRDIKRIFYESVVPEATKGKVNVYFIYGIAFSTNLMEYNKIYKCNVDNVELTIPTLMISNKDIFDELLAEYVDKAMRFYDNSNFYDEIVDDKNYDDDTMICKEKDIIAHLFANATYEDFNDPISFLKRRIAFLENHNDRLIDCGYSKILNANISLNICKDSINNEASSQMVLMACKNNQKYIFPRVKFGIDNDTVYIYAIQNEDDNKDDLSKKINRTLYKVGEGFKDDSNEENLRDITASFLVALNMAISYFKANGYDKIVVPSMLVVRWNAKRIMHESKYKKKKIDFPRKEELDKQLDSIQYNLTNKLIRTFLRLACHYNNLNVDSFPYEVDSFLHISVNNGIDSKCNNALLYETGGLIANAIGNIKSK